MQEETKTQIFDFHESRAKEIRRVIREVYLSLEEAGYDPKSQIIGYAVSGDPIFIPRHNDARRIMQSIDRTELLEEMLEFYVKSALTMED